MSGAPLSGLDVESCARRIRARNDRLNAVLTVLDPPERDASAAGGPLAGVPYVLKDTWDTAGIVTTGGSWRHRDRVPSVSSHAHAAFRAAGAVLLGKSNLCDLAFSAESDNHLRGPVRNPYDLARTAGGSTGGGAAAVADGMAAFDWGTDFGGSIRGPAAFCGLVGLRLSHGAWPVGIQHFPRIAPFFWDLCGMGPLTKTVEDSRFVLAAVRGALRDASVPDVPMEPRSVVIYAPDTAHGAEWPSFVADTSRLLDRAGVAFTLERSLPTPSAVNHLFTEYLASHFQLFVEGDELPLRDAIPAVLLGLVSGGRLDKRVHPNTGILFAGTAALSLRYRDRARPAAALARLRAAAARVWSNGTLILTPTVTARPPKHGRSALAYRLMSFCKLGNLLDGTGLALPFGTFPGSPLARSLQILGPVGSENAVVDLAARLEGALHS